MIDWLELWGVTKAVGFAFKPILEDLAKESSKNWVTGFFKDTLSNIKDPPSIASQKKAAGKAIKEFLYLSQLELEDAELTDSEIRLYTNDFKKLVKDKSTVSLLGQAFKTDNQPFDINDIKERWKFLNHSELPTNFSWEILIKRYYRKVLAIKRESKELLKILNSEYLERIADNTSKIVGIPPNFELEKYSKALLENYGNMNLDSLEHDGYAYNELKLWQMFIPQSLRECEEFIPRYYELPKDVQNKFIKTGVLDQNLQEIDVELYRKAYFDQPISSVIEIIDDDEMNYSVFLGDPGSGKSTLLQYIAIEWANNLPQDLTNNPIPLLIELRSYVRDCDKGICNDFLSFYNHGNVICRLDQIELHNQLLKGNVIVMFDGLDEVFNQAKRDAVVTSILRFAKDYPLVRLIITSRVIGYQPRQFKAANFHHYMIQDLDDNQIEDFISRWHNLTYSNPLDRNQKHERLQKAISDSDAIRELAGNPLLLTMMAILNKNQELPRDRADLYEQASRLLLYIWDVERTLKDEEIDPRVIDFRDKKYILQKIAYKMQETAGGISGNIIDAETLEKVITYYLEEFGIINARGISRALIDNLRIRNFILCYIGSDLYAFVHRTFLEYFCASEIVDSFEKQRALSEDDLTYEIFGKYWHIESWHEILRLIAGMIGARFTGNIIEYLIELDGENEHFNNLILAAYCISEVRNRSPLSSIEQRLYNKLQKLLDYGSLYYKDFKHQERAKKVRSNTVKVIAKVWKRDAGVLEILKHRAQKDAFKEVRGIAMQELIKGWKNDPDTLKWLKILTKSEENEDVKRVALQELIRGWKEESETYSIVLSLAQDDDNWEIRKSAMQFLIKEWEKNSKTLNAFKYIATNDANKYLRILAINELATRWKDSPNIRSFINSFALKDREVDIRICAIRGLIKGWRSEPKVKQTISMLAQDDKDNNVRLKSMTELSKIWHNLPETFETVKQIAQMDQDTIVRRAALLELSKRWIDFPDTRLILKERVLIDKEPLIRFFSLLEIVNRWTDISETFNLVIRVAKKDKDSNNRKNAMKMLINKWTNEQEVKTTIQDIAQDKNDKDNDLRSYAIQLLSHYWQADSSTLSTLISLIGTNDHYSIRRTIMGELIDKWISNSITKKTIMNIAEQDSNVDIRNDAIQELTKHWKSDLKVHTLIKWIAEKSEIAEVQSTALKQLTKYWSDNRSTIDLLKTLANRSNKKSIKLTSVIELINRYSSNSEIQNFVMEKVIQENDENIKAKILTQLTRVHYKDDETLALLKNYAQFADHASVRIVSLKLLAEFYRNDFEVLSIIKKQITNNDYGSVRLGAIDALIMTNKNDKSIINLLETTIQHDIDSEVRCGALKGLVHLNQNDINLLTTIKGLCVSDDGADVRSLAVQILSQLWKDRQGLIDFLYDMSLNDPFKRENDRQTNPRLSSAEIMYKKFSNHPKTIELFKKMQNEDSDENVREYTRKSYESLLEGPQDKLIT